MHKSPKVSIVIPCYNLGAFVQDAIESVYAQTYKDYEIIVVDDGSTDDRTVKDLQELGKKYPALRIFYKSNSGLPGARNYGVTRAQGEYVVCLDADDKLAPEFLEKTVHKLEEDTSHKVAFVTTWLQEFGERDNVWQTQDFDVIQLLTTNTVHVASLFRKKAWDEVGGYKKGMSRGYEDWEFWLSIVERGYRWAIVPEPLFLYRIRANSMLSSSKEIHLELYKDLYDLHEELFKKNARDLTLENALLISSLRGLVNEKDSLIRSAEAKIADNNATIEDLGSQLISTREELDDMKNSRLMKKAMAVRRAAGRLRGMAFRIKYFPRRVLRKLKSFLPAPVRIVLRRIYVAGRSRYIAARTQITIVANQPLAEKQPLLSVIIPFYNRGDTIEETIRSLKNQTFTNFEVILVDDGSTDPASIQKAKEIDKSKALSSVIYQKNQGVAAARNNGINASAGKYIVCLDSDDLLEPTYIEKCLLLMEARPDISLVTSYADMFGVISRLEPKQPYDPITLYSDNMVITAAAYTKEAWRLTGGYKSGIGYEDWEFWINMAENGFWGRVLPEPLFRYRTATESRYVDDKRAHWDNMQRIKMLHPNYRRNVKKLLSKNRLHKLLMEPRSAFINLASKKGYPSKPDRKNILMVLPWMTFGGAETLILNFCQEIKDTFNISFVTGLESKNEWEYKFQEITPNIYHLANLFDTKELWVEFIVNYVKTRDIDTLHIIHTDVVFDILPKIKQRCPGLRVIVTMFNDRVGHFKKSIESEKYVDTYVSDNSKVARSYKEGLTVDRQITVIPNGINSVDKFNPDKYNRDEERTRLGLNKDDIAVFFIGRLSEEKNPDVFLKVAKNIVQSDKSHHTKFFVVGDGVMRETVDKLIKSIGSEDVTNLGYQSDIPKYLSTADIFILPSSIEGFPLSILEAMAMKVAVIASDVGCVSEVVTTGADGFVTTPASATEMTELVRQLSQDRELLRRIKDNARLKIDSKYSNIILGENYKKLYKRGGN